MTLVSRQAMRFPVNSNLPPVHIRAVRDISNGQTYHRDEFDCFIRTGDEVTFDWKDLNHTDKAGVEGPRWVGVELEEILEFTRPEVLFEDVKAHLQALESDLKAILDLEVSSAPLPVLALFASAQREVRQGARMLGVKLDG